MPLRAIAYKYKFSKTSRLLGLVMYLFMSCASNEKSSPELDSWYLNTWSPGGVLGDVMETLGCEVWLEEVYHWRRTLRTYSLAPPPVVFLFPVYRRDVVSQFPDPAPLRLQPLWAPRPLELPK